MKIIIEELPEGEEEYILIKCRQMTPELLRVLDSLKTEPLLTAYSGNEIYRVKSSDIYYIETVDNRVFFYSESAVYESRNKLYELEELLPRNDFLRISKSVILNLSKVQKLIPALSGRFEAVLHNGLKVIISRQYVTELKKRLGI